MYVLGKYIKQINSFKISSMAFLRKSGDDVEDNDSVESSEEQRDHLRRAILNKYYLLIHRHRIC